MNKIVAIFLIIVCSIFLVEVVVRFNGYSSYTLLTNEEKGSIYQVGKFEAKNQGNVDLLNFFKANEHGFMVLNESSDFNTNKEAAKYALSSEMYYLLDNYFKSEEINEYGFRDWKKEDVYSQRRKVALIGDSYVWGVGAKPVDSSFANLLKTDTSFQVFNLAVPGVDLAVYAKIAEVYLPIIQPEICLLFVYAGNDLVQYKKELMPFEYNDIYPTNIGALYKLNQNYLSEDSVEVFMDFESAYTTMKSVINFENPLAIFASFNYIYRAIYGLNASVPYRYKRYKKINYSSVLLSKIKAVSDKTNTKLIVVMIPSLNKGTHEKLESELETKVFEARGFSKNDFNLESDGHLNNEGCKKYAAFVHDLISNSSRKE